MHLIPIARDAILRHLGDQLNITLLEPQNYDRMVYLMMGACIIQTDSGGLQDEAPSLNFPCSSYGTKRNAPSGRSGMREFGKDGYNIHPTRNRHPLDRSRRI